MKKEKLNAAEKIIIIIIILITILIFLYPTIIKNFEKKENYIEICKNNSEFKLNWIETNIQYNIEKYYISDKEIIKIKYIISPEKTDLFPKTEVIEMYNISSKIDNQYYITNNICTLKIVNSSIPSFDSFQKNNCLRESKTTKILNQNFSNTVFNISLNCTLRKE